jgi:hypothetical protein
MNKSELKKLARGLIFDAIKCEDNPTIEAVRDRFESEYGWMIARDGKYRACIEWLLGLALHVPYSTYEIEKIGFKDGKDIGQYWDLLREAFLFITREPQGGRGKIPSKNIAQASK